MLFFLILSEIFTIDKYLEKPDKIQINITFFLKNSKNHTKTLF